MTKSKYQIRPDIKSNIAVYKIDGTLTYNNATKVLKRIEDHLPILRGMKIDGLLLSFEGVSQIDENALIKTIEEFSIFYVQLRSMVGFCNYSSAVYPVLRKLIKQTPLGLYKNLDIMALAIGTSSINRNSSILIYAQDVSERQLIASTLISNEYFVIMALSRDDFKKKLEDKGRYDKIVNNSYFSNIHEDVIVSFDKKTFTYEFQGALDKTLRQRINIENFRYRLSIGYTVVVFNFTNIYNLDSLATHFLVELENIAKEYNALVCCIGLINRKIEANAISVLEKSSLWLYDDISQIYEDEEVIKMIKSKQVHFNTSISKKLLELSPRFVTASMQALDIYEIHQISKNPSKQARAKDLYDLKHYIITHITFSGDYDGEFLFLFSKESVQMIINNILVDSSVNYTKDDYLDAMSEFVNSITGKLKSNLRKKNDCILFSLPYSSTNLDDVIFKDLNQTFILSKFSSNEASYHVALSSPIDIDN